MSRSAHQKPRLGIFLRGGDYTYQNEIVLGAHYECQERGVDLYCFAGGVIDTPDARNLVYDLVGAGDLDGVILVAGTMGSEDAPEIETLFKRFAGLPMCVIGTPRLGIASLGVDNQSGIRELTEHLIKKHQRRRIAFVAGPNHESKRRLMGYREALLGNGLPFDESLVIAGDFTPPSGARAVAALFDGGGGCDAIVAANDWMAIGALDALNARGLRVPEDVALIGFDDVEQARFVNPPLTTVRQPPRQLGVRAVRRVLDIADGQTDTSTGLLPTATIIRQSCGCTSPKPDLELDVPSADESLLSALGNHRASWIRAVAAAAPLLDEVFDDPALIPNVPALLVDALLRDLQYGTEHSFVMAVDGLVRQSEQLSNIGSWHHTISKLRCEAVTSLSGSVRAWLRAETVFEQAHISISALAEHAQARRRLEKETLTRGLEDLSVAVRTALDLPALRAALVRHLPELRIPSLFIASHAGRPGPDDYAELIFAYDDENQSEPAGPDRPFRVGEVVPPDLRPPWRHSVMVQPLFFDDQPLGFCVMEIGARDGSVFKTVPELISTAIKAIQLASALVEEATRRQRAERDRMSQELEIAARIQTGILPTELEVPGLEIATSMLPATEVGGDYFDILPCEGGCWLGIGDVAGHGLHTGLVMLMIQSIVAATTLAEPNAAPSRVWQSLNAVLHDNVRKRLHRDEHATLTLLRYHSDGQLDFAGAHEDLIIHRAASGACERIPTPGLWAGIVPKPPAGSVVDLETRLAPGDVLLLYTDGLIESRNAERGAFGIERVCACLEAVASRPVHEIRDHLLSELLAWTTRQRDDVTLVVLRYCGTV